MRFDTYTKELALITEKVSKAEIDEALKNPNLIVGMEFEFICDALNEWDNEDLSDAFDSAMEDYEQFNEDWQEYEDQQEKLQKQMDDLGDQQSELDEEDEDYQEQYDQLQAKIDELDEELNGLEYPEPGTSYDNYLVMLEERFGENVEYDASSGSIPEPPTYEDYAGNIADEDNWLEAVESMKDFIFRDFPVKGVHIRVENQAHTNQQSMGDMYWKAEYDSSIAQDGGMELISPPIPLPEMVALLPALFKWIGKKGGTNANCGLHAHLGFGNVKDLSEVVDPIKLALLVDEGHIWKNFEGRQFSEYCKRMQTIVADRGITSEDLSKMVNKDKLMLGITAEHSHGINFESWKKGHIEFRYMGGADYEKKADKVIANLGRYAHALSAACDPDYKYREFTLKLMRLSNKLDALRWEKASDYIKEFRAALAKSDAKEAKAALALLDRHIVAIEAKFKDVKIDSEVVDIMNRNKGFVEGAEELSKNILTDFMKKTKLTDIKELATTLKPWYN